MNKPAFQSSPLNTPLSVALFNTLNFTPSQATEQNLQTVSIEVSTFNWSGMNIQDEICCVSIN